MVDKVKIENAVKMILEALGEDINREGLIDTPKRVARMFEEITSGNRDNPENHLSKVFDVKNSQMIIEKDIQFFSTCEHHLMPFFGKAHIAYIPSDKVVGLSKLARVVDTFSKRLQLQEQMTNQIAQSVFTTLNAKGVFVMVEAEHTCMTMRGVQKFGSKTITYSALGDFKDNLQLQNYVMGMVKNV